MNKFIITLLVLVVIIGGGYYAWTHSKWAGYSQPPASPSMQNPTGSPSMKGPTSPPPASVAQTYTVTYTDSGFSPDTITIKSGDTVKFVNESSELVRVASNPHPIHTDYPGFDSINPFSNGQSYSFTFSRIGHWGYHNHLNPSVGGTVVVE